MKKLLQPITMPHWLQDFLFTIPRVVCGYLLTTDFGAAKFSLPWSPPDNNLDFFEVAFWFPNSNFGKNFNDFVNEYRVEEFKKQIKLPQNQNYTLLAVAFDCGFNSKATFNRAFKKFTGQSPSRFEEV